MTYRQELLNVPRKKTLEPLHNVGALYIIPSRRKHDSGYACMDLVACRMDKSRRITNDKIRLGGGCDAIELRGDGFRIDCIHPSGIIRIFSFSPFCIPYDLSSVSLEMEDYVDDFDWNAIKMSEVDNG